MCVCNFYKEFSLIKTTVEEKIWELLKVPIQSSQISQWDSVIIYQTDENQKIRYIM